MSLNIMLIKKLKEIVEKQHSNSENDYLISKYILEHPYEVVNYSVNDLSKETFTSNSSVIRFSKKLGFKGFPELKIAIAKDIDEFYGNEEKVEFNIPIKQGQSKHEISKVFFDLYVQTIEETYKHLNMESLEKAAKLITEADHVTIYGKSNSLLVAENFYLKIRKIGIVASCDSLRGFQRVLTRKKRIKEIAVFISHYLNNEQTKKMIFQLKEHGYKVILVTSNIESPICKIVDVVLGIFNGESYVKMGNFSSQLAEEFVLDILYGILFERDYNQNIELISRVNGGFDENQFR